MNQDLEELEERSSGEDASPPGRGIVKGPFIRDGNCKQNSLFSGKRYNTLTLAVSKFPLYSLTPRDKIVQDYIVP